MAVNSQSRLKMITAHEWDRLWCYNHILSQPETREEQKEEKKKEEATCNMYATRRRAHRLAHTHARTQKNIY